MIKQATEQQFEFAPAAVIRAAGWAFESLDSFGDYQLAELALCAATKGHFGNKNYVERYQEVLERERNELWRMTAGDGLFMKAILLSNPRVARRARRSAPKRGRRTKSIRHLETTLFRYLARACGRTVPNGLWGRVGLIQLSETAPDVPSRGPYCFTPDLRPFQEILKSLGLRSHYRCAALWRANPTLRRETNGDWRYWARTKNGELDRREVENHGEVDRILKTIEKLGAGTFSEIVKAAGADESLVSTLVLLADAGAIVGGLTLPNRFASVWEALSIAGARLTAQDRATWDACVRELESTCSELSRLNEMGIEELEERLQRASEAVEELARTLGMPRPDLPDPLLRCDSALTFDLTLTADHQRVLIQALQEYQDIWINRVSPATLRRSELRSLFAKYLEDGVLLQDLDWHWNDGESHYEADWELVEGSKERSEVVLSYDSSPRNGLIEAPVACFYAGLFEGFRLAVHGLSEDPARAFARHAVLLGPNPLEEWLTTHLHALAQRHSLRIAQLCVPFERNPNVLASPGFGALPIELWDSSDGALTLNGARLFVDPASRMPFLALPGIDEPFAVFCFASADIGARDRVARQLLWTAFQDAPEPNCRLTVLPCEKDEPRFTPRICLPGGAVLRPRRTVLSGGRLNALARLNGLERYATWQQLAASYRWPGLLLIQRDDEPPMLVKSNSPLALESLFKGVGDHITSLIVGEVPGRPWLTDAHGRHYMAEIALPFARRAHSWSARGER
jgi:hypothetical protein